MGFRMCERDPFECLVSKPTDAVKFPRRQQAGVYRDCLLFCLLVQSGL